jgi:hypothetical protein
LVLVTSCGPSPTSDAARVTAKAVLAAAARLGLTNRHLAAAIGVSASVDTSNPATDVHRKTGHHAEAVRLG